MLRLLARHYVPGGNEDDRGGFIWYPDNWVATFLDAQPYFFGSGVLVEQDGLRTVEYCVLDAFATIALKFRAAWVMNWTGRRSRWQPTPQALPGP